MERAEIIEGALLGWCKAPGRTFHNPSGVERLLVYGRGAVRNDVVISPFDDVSCVYRERLRLILELVDDDGVYLARRVCRLRRLGGFPLRRCGGGGSP